MRRRAQGWALRPPAFGGFRPWPRRRIRRFGRGRNDGELCALHW